MLIKLKILIYDNTCRIVDIFVIDFGKEKIFALIFILLQRIVPIRRLYQRVLNVPNKKIKIVHKIIVSVEKRLMTSKITRASTTSMRRDEACDACNCTIEMSLSTLVCRKHLDADRLRISNSTLVEWDIFELLLS